MILDRCTAPLIDWQIDSNRTIYTGGALSGKAHRQKLISEYLARMTFPQFPTPKPTHIK